MIDGKFQVNVHYIKQISDAILDGPLAEETLNVVAGVSFVDSLSLVCSRYFHEVKRPVVENLIFRGSQAKLNVLPTPLVNFRKPFVG